MSPGMETESQHRRPTAAQLPLIEHFRLRGEKPAVTMAFIAKPVKPGTHADKSKRKRVHVTADDAKLLHKKAKVDTSKSGSKHAAK